MGLIIVSRRYLPEHRIFKSPGTLIPHPPVFRRHPMSRRWRYRRLTDFTCCSCGGREIDVSDCYFRSFTGKILSDRPADAAAGARDQSRFIFESHFFAEGIVPPAKLSHKIFRLDET